MGGMIVQQIAVRHPAAVRSLADPLPVVGGGPVHEGADAQLAVDRPRAGMPELLRQIWLWVFTPRFYAEQPEAFVELERQVAENPHAQTRGGVLRPGGGVR